MPPLDTARCLIRALSMPLPTRLAKPGTNSAKPARDDEFIMDIELQDLSESLTSTPNSSRPSTPAFTTTTTSSRQAFDDDQLADIALFRSRFPSRSAPRSSFDSTSSTPSTHSRSSSRSSRSTVRSSNELVRKKRPVIRRRESDSCWREYWD